MSFAKVVEDAATQRASNRSILRKHTPADEHSADIAPLIERMRKQAPLLKTLAERHHILIGTQSSAVHDLAEQFERKSEALIRYVETFPTLEIPLLFLTSIEEELLRLTKFRFRHVTFRIIMEQLTAAMFDAGRWTQWLQVIVHNKLPFKSSLVLVLHERIAYRPETRETLLRFIDCLDGQPLHIEFEHWTWNKEGRRQELWAALSGRGMLPIGWDGPLLPGIVQRRVVGSRHGAHVRMLGRNAAGWFDTATKHQYSYTQKELLEFASALTPERPLYITLANDPPLRALANAIDLAEVFAAMLKKNV